jgi:hypothetical protein
MDHGWVMVHGVLSRKREAAHSGTFLLENGPMLSPPRPGTNWADWSDAMGREMYLRRALDRLNFEYPPDDAS